MNEEQYNTDTSSGRSHAFYNAANEVDVQQTEHNLRASASIPLGLPTPPSSRSERVQHESRIPHTPHIPRGPHDSRLREFLMGSRPATWPLSIAPVIVGLAASCMDYIVTGLPWSAFGDYFWAYAFLSLLVALGLQMAANFYNDYSDGLRGVDSMRSPYAPKRMNASGDKSAAKRSLRYALCCALVAVVAGVGAVLLSKQYGLLAVGAVCALAAFAYSKWLSLLGLGEIMAFVFFGIVPVWGVQWLVIRTISLWAILASIHMGIMSAAVLMINNLRDYDSDSAVGKRTLVVRAGREQSIYILIGSLGVTIAISTAQMWGVWFGLNFVVPAWAVGGMVVCWLIFVAFAGLVTVRLLKVVATCKKMQLVEARIYKIPFIATIAMTTILACQYMLYVVVVNAL